MTPPFPRSMMSPLDAAFQTAAADRLRAAREGRPMSVRTWWKHSRVVLILAGVAAPVGIACHVVGHYGQEAGLVKWLADTLHVTADALIVAALLGLTVDRYLKTQLMRDVGAIFIGWALPHEVRNYIREVSQTALVRREHDASYTLELVGEAEVKVTVMITFRVFNYGLKAMDYGVELVQDLSKNPYRDEVACAISTPDGGDEHWNVDRFRREGGEATADGVVKWVAKTVSLRPQDVLADPDRKPRCTVTWTYSFRARRDDDEWLVFGTPVLGLRISAKCPPELVFRCDHGSGETTADGRWVWSFPDQFFASGRCIHVRWSPAKSDARGKVGWITV